MDNQDKQIAQLEQQLSETLRAQGGLESDFGRLLVDFLAQEITRLTREVTSDKFRKDLMGYNIALADLHANQKLLKKLQLAAAPAREKAIRRKLGEYEDAE